MRNPEMTKKTSTPMNPPANPVIPACYATTTSTATARSPSISRRCCTSGNGIGVILASALNAEEVEIGKTLVPCASTFHFDVSSLLGAPLRNEKS